MDFLYTSVWDSLTVVTFSILDSNLREIFVLENRLPAIIDEGSRQGIHLFKTSKDITGFLFSGLSL
jgi:hypothetical protein